MNKVTLLGRIGKDPETRTFENGSVTSFPMATSESYKDKEGNRKEKTEWHNISAWGKLGEIIAQYFKKGDPILIEGKITYREYEKDGNKRFITEIIANSFEFLPKSGGSEGKSDNTSSVDLSNIDNGEDDLPF